MIAWHGSNAQQQIILNDILRKITLGQGMPFPAQCPICSFYSPTLHAYFNSRGPAKLGGVWIWCSHCGTYFHGSIHPPIWWDNLPEVDSNQLTVSPEYLDTFSNQIDALWKTLPRGL